MIGIHTDITESKQIEEKLAEMDEEGFRQKLIEKLELVKKGSRDLYF